MTSRDFCYWLQGFFELSKENIEKDGLTGPQARMIRDHLKLVFVHDLDPKAGPPEVQKALNEIHGGGDGGKDTIFRC